MTTEEAIKVLKIEKESYYGLVEEAICVALAALRAQAEAEKNEPLTLDELREMDGKPVWLHTYSAVQKKTAIACWAIVGTVSEANVTFVRAGCNSRLIKWFANWNTRWLTYRRKPEEAPADG